MASALLLPAVLLGGVQFSLQLGSEMSQSRSVSLSSEGCPVSPDPEDVDSDELMGSQSRRWLKDLLAADKPPQSGDVSAVGRDGLFVDYHFPVGELEMQTGVRWKRPKVK